MFLQFIMLACHETSDPGYSGDDSVDSTGDYNPTVTVPEGATPKSLLIVTLEATPWKMLNASAMPNLTAFSQKAFVAGRHFVPGSWTCMGAGSLMLGRFPWIVDPETCHGLDNPYPSDVRTLSDILGDVGYFTHYQCENRVAGSLSGLAGDHWDDFDEDTQGARENVARVLTVMRENVGRPAHVMAHFMEPHDQHDRLAESCKAAAEVASDACYELTGLDVTMDESKAFNSLEMSPQAEDACAEALEVAQSCEGTSLDEALHDLFLAFKPVEEGGEGFGDDWILVFVTDHGEAWGDPGLSGEFTANHNQGLMSHATRGIYIERDPDTVPGTLEVATNQVDVVPHLLAKLGVTGAGSFDGKPFDEIEQDRVMPAYWYREGMSAVAAVSGDGTRHLVVDWEGRVGLYNPIDDVDEHVNLYTGSAPSDLQAVINEVTDATTTN